MKKQFQSLFLETASRLHAAKSEQEVEKLETGVLGRKGNFNHLLEEIKQKPKQEWPALFAAANKTKTELVQLFAQSKQFGGKKNELFTVDVTEPGKKPDQRPGHPHPLTLANQELTSIFLSMNYQVFDGPELDSEWHVFEGLNIPSWHPARDIQDTFFVDLPDVDHQGSKQRLVMRAHTSNMQLHVMERLKPPFRAGVLGRIFRNEATDASHEHTFHQCEGFAVDESMSIGNLISTMKTMLEGFFQKKIKVRLRPAYFPFVEPGYELYCSCLFCNEKGCQVCKQSGWIETVGCGMIHPNVFAFAGYPKGKFRGFAFGMGVDRLTMLKYGIHDIRLFQSGDFRFINQF